MKKIIPLLVLESVARTVYAMPAVPVEDGTPITQSAAATLGSGINQLSTNKVHVSNAMIVHYQAHTRYQHPAHFIGRHFGQTLQHYQLASYDDDSTKTQNPHCYTPPCHNDHTDCGIGHW